MFRSPKILQWLFPSRVWGISVSDKSIFLTFDDGPDPEITSWILDFLQEEKISATFFCVGENVKKHSEIYHRIIAENHAVGNHCMRHENGYKVTDDVYLDSINEAAQFIDSNLFRPPYGRLRKRTERKIPKKFKIIMWSWLSYDYDQKVSPQKIIQSSAKIKQGDILVFHDNKKTKERLKEILPPIVKALKEKGFEFRVVI